MAEISWEVQGEYFETCSCDYLCPCISSNLTAKPTKGSCTVALVFHVERGKYGDVQLDGLNAAVLAYTPGAMANGDWTVGMVTDANASTEQSHALAAIMSGQGGGPMAALSPLIGAFKGVESRPIHFEMNGMHRSISIPDVLDQAAVGVPGGASPDEPMYLDNVPHPVNTRLALARAERSHLHAFGLDWDDTSGNNNGHYAPFHWRA
ncbi:MAG TPA: DUF1326 domain-containing protein [Chloroflexota bacterium]